MNTSNLDIFSSSLTIDEEATARANLERYLRVVLRIHARVRNDGPAEASQPNGAALDDSVSGSYDSLVDPNDLAGRPPRP